MQFWLVFVDTQSCCNVTAVHVISCINEAPAKMNSQYGEDEQKSDKASNHNQWQKYPAVLYKKRILVTFFIFYTGKNG